MILLDISGLSWINPPSKTQPKFIKKYDVIWGNTSVKYDVGIEPKFDFTYVLFWNEDRYIRGEQRWSKTYKLLEESSVTLIAQKYHSILLAFPLVIPCALFRKDTIFADTLVFVVHRRVGCPPCRSSVEVEPNAFFIIWHIITSTCKTQVIDNSCIQVRKA